ncbi:MAG: nucleotide sugar dehydrogenase, partial [Oscillospiraceae bacterium]|nr:nucleotide sugar dehydrogenase [Oscillospiraceae bacterium]
MKIAVAGVGYVGLVTAVTLADVGHDVICLDVDKGKLKMLKEGISPIYEYGLEELMLKNRERLEFTDDVTKYSEAQVIIIGVGTPEKEDGSADLSAVFSVTDSIADNCSDGTVVVVKSTVPIGTCESVRRRIGERRPDLHFFVVSNPEFLSQGTAVRDTFNADRIVIGADDEQAYKTVEEMY